MSIAHEAATPPLKQSPSDVGVAGTVTMPVEIPVELQRAAQPLSGPDLGLFGWTRRDALAVLATLTDTRIAVARGEVYRTMAHDPVPIDDWDCRRAPREDANAYAARSQSAAERRVKRHLDEYSGAVLFVFTFDDQQAAA